MHFLALLMSSLCKLPNLGLLGLYESSNAADGVDHATKIQIRYGPSHIPRYGVKELELLRLERCSIAIKNTIKEEDGTG